MKASIVGIFLLIFLSLHAYPQLQGNSDVAIVYDPLFWKKDLRLSASQCFHIRSINARFYESLKEVATGPTAVAQKRKQCIDLLQQRSNAIWGLFSRRQKNEWKRLDLDKTEIANGRSVSYMILQGGEEELLCSLVTADQNFLLATVHRL